ncbi:hypothetical protein R1E69_20845, partial [Escherichia coli]
MSGKPAARQGDMTQYGGSIVQGSAGVRIGAPTGRLTGVHTTAANLDIRIPYATDPAGNRLPDPELHP